MGSCTICWSCKCRHLCLLLCVGKSTTPTSTLISSHYEDSDIGWTPVFTISQWVREAKIRLGLSSTVSWDGDNPSTLFPLGKNVLQPPKWPHPLLHLVLPSLFNLNPKSNLRERKRRGWESSSISSAAADTTSTADISLLGSSVARGSF